VLDAFQNIRSICSHVTKHHIVGTERPTPIDILRGDRETWDLRTPPSLVRWCWGGGERIGIVFPDLVMTVLRWAPILLLANSNQLSLCLHYYCCCWWHVGEIECVLCSKGVLSCNKHICCLTHARCHLVAMIFSVRLKGMFLRLQACILFIVCIIHELHMLVFMLHRCRRFSNSLATVSEVCCIHCFFLLHTYVQNRAKKLHIHCVPRGKCPE
jgi:hypothetical protein